MNTLLTYIRPCVVSVLRQGRHSFLIGMEMLCFFVCDGAPSLLFLQIVSNSTSRKRRQTSAGDGNRFLLSITGFQSSIDRKERVQKMTIVHSWLELLYSGARKQCQPRKQLQIVDVDFSSCHGGHVLNQAAYTVP